MKHYLPLALAALLLAPVSSFAADLHSSEPSPMKPAEPTVSAPSEQVVEESSQAEASSHNDKSEAKHHHPAHNTTSPDNTPTEVAPEKSSQENPSEPIKTSAQPANQNLKQLFNQFNKESDTQAQSTNMVTAPEQ